MVRHLLHLVIHFILYQVPDAHLDISWSPPLNLLVQFKIIQQFHDFGHEKKPPFIHKSCEQKRASFLNIIVEGETVFFSPVPFNTLVRKDS